MVLELYDFFLVVMGITLLGVAILPRLVSRQPISMPIFFVGFGMASFALLPLPAIHPLDHPDVAERLAELGVIVALMALGLKIDRPPGFPEWASTIRLLAITMPLSIAGAALLGWTLGGLVIPTAVLLGAVIAPTDPVLASEVQEGDPGENPRKAEPSDVEPEDEIRFALSSEAGLNDGLAFPFTNLAIALVLVGIAPENWIGDWLLVDVGYRIVVGLLIGLAGGSGLARLIFATMPETMVAQSVKGIEAIAGTLLVYGATELVGGYGFIAVFVAAMAIRDHERSHEYNAQLHEVAELAEQVLLGVIMVLFGGVIVGGLLAPLTLELIAVAVVIVFLVRPLAGVIGLARFTRSWADRSIIAFFGIRGIGSFYYLSHGINEAPFEQAELVWAIVGAVVLTSIVVHGITATPVVRFFELR